MDGERLSRTSPLRDQTAELRFRAVLAVYEGAFAWPADESISSIVRTDMQPDIQAHARIYLQAALDLAAEQGGNEGTGEAWTLHKPAQLWLAQISTVPHGRGATNLDRLKDAVSMADRGHFCPGELSALWQDLSDRVRRD